MSRSVGRRASETVRLGSRLQCRGRIRIQGLAQGLIPAWTQCEQARRPWPQAREQTREIHTHRWRAVSILDEYVMSPAVLHPDVMELGLCRNTLTATQLGEQGGQTHQSASAHGLRPFPQRAATHQLCQLREDGTAKEVRKLLSSHGTAVHAPETVHPVRPQTG